MKNAKLKKTAQLFAQAFILVCVKLFFLFLTIYSLETGAVNPFFGKGIVLYALGFASFLFGMDLSNFIERRFRKYARKKEPEVIAKAILIRFAAFIIGSFCLSQSHNVDGEFVRTLFRTGFYFCFIFGTDCVYVLTTVYPKCSARED